MKIGIILEVFFNAVLIWNTEFFHCYFMYYFYVCTYVYILICETVMKFILILSKEILR